MLRNSPAPFSFCSPLGAGDIYWRNLKQKKNAQK